MINFFVTYVDENNIIVRDVSKISLRYFKSKFAFHVLTAIPYQVFFKFQYSRFFYLIKGLRILETSELLDTARFMNNVKDMFEKRLKKLA